MGHSGRAACLFTPLRVKRRRSQAFGRNVHRARAPVGVQLLQAGEHAFHPSAEGLHLQEGPGARAKDRVRDRTRDGVAVGRQSVSAFLAAAPRQLPSAATNPSPLPPYSGLESSLPSASSS